MIKNIIIDLDDTMIATNIIYLDMINAFGEYIEKELGIPKVNVIEIESGIDLQNALIHQEYTLDRFPRSFYITSTVCDQIKGIPINIARAEISYNIGNNVYDEKRYQVFPETINFLNWCVAQNYNLYLWTKGDISTQLRKLEHTKLLEYFPVANRYIVAKKDVTGLEEIVTKIHKLDKEECLMIGDSLRDDIKAAHYVGIKSIWIENKKNAGWVYNNSPHLYDWLVNNLMQIPAIIEAYNK